MRRRFDRMRRRQPVATWGFLRPTQRQAEDERERREHLKSNPALQREVRSSLLIQLGILGLLTASCIVLLVESLRFLTRIQLSGSGVALAWGLPLFVGFLGFAALRRFLRVLAEYRDFRRL